MGVNPAALLLEVVLGAGPKQTEEQLQGGCRLLGCCRVPCSALGESDSVRDVLFSGAEHPPVLLCECPGSGWQSRVSHPTIEAL